MKRFIKKGFLCCAAAWLLSFLCCGQALAAASAQPVRVFAYQNTLYTYMKLEGIDQPVTQAEAKIGNQSFGASTRLETVRQAGFPITYLLLVDNSTSMPPFSSQLEEFTTQLAEDSGVNTRFILATLGDSFQMVNEDVPAENLGEAVSSLAFDQDVTRLHTCMSSALDYFETLPRQGNELRCMIVITDAVQYDPQGGVPYEELLDRVQHSDVMLHSLGLGSDAAALESLGKLTGASGGIHQVVGESLTPAAAADTLSEEGGNLMVVGFDLTGCTASGEDQPVSFTFASGGTLLCKGEAKADLLLSGTAAEEETVPAATSSEAEPEEPQIPPESGIPSSDQREENKQSTAADGQEQTGGFWIAGCITVGILILALLLWLVLRKRKNV